MATYERLDYGSDDGSQWGVASTDKLGFYGFTPVVQRAASTQATSVFSGISTGAVSTNSLVLATLLEVCNTLAGLGIWKGAA